MRYEQILATLIIALLAGTIGAYLVSTGRDPLQTRPQIVTALQQVSASGKLNCGYIESAPAFVKEANGAFSGIWYRLTETLANRAGLEIIWAAPTTPETLASDLKARKFAALCTGFPPDLALAKDLAFSAPAYRQDGRLMGFVTLAVSGDLRDFLSLGVNTLNAEGEIDKILQKHETQPSPYQRLAPPAP